VEPADAVVSGFRARFDADAVARRIPPHVTVLFPFHPAGLVDAGVRAAIAGHARTLDAFDAALVGVGTFEQHVWLAPAPRERFVALVEATCRRFPELPPYEGAFPNPEPHLTVGAVGDAGSLESIAEAARAELAPRLPVAFRVDALSLYEEQPDDTWALASSFPLR
jgi:2'-5' RNA ligase